MKRSDVLVPRCPRCGTAHVREEHLVTETWEIPDGMIEDDGVLRVLNEDHGMQEQGDMEPAPLRYSCGNLKCQHHFERPLTQLDRHLPRLLLESKLLKQILHAVGDDRLKRILTLRNLADHINAYCDMLLRLDDDMWRELDEVRRDSYDLSDYVDEDDDD